MRIGENSEQAKEYMKKKKGIRVVGPHGNLGRVDPQSVAMHCDMLGIPWWTSAWPYSSGITCYIPEDSVWNGIKAASKY